MKTYEIIILWMIPHRFPALLQIAMNSECHCIAMSFFLLFSLPFKITLILQEFFKNNAFETCFSQLFQIVRWISLIPHMHWTHFSSKHTHLTQIAVSGSHVKLSKTKQNKHIKPPATMNYFSLVGLFENLIGLH